MKIIRTAKPAKEMADVKLWHCAGCGVVHLSVKDTVLNFSREDFAAFTQTAVEINYCGWESASPFSIIDLGDDAEFRANATVH